MIPNVRYESGEELLAQCKSYLLDNLDFLRNFLQGRISEIKLVEPDGKYDCSGTGLDRKELNDLIINKAKLWLDAGHIFERKSESFQRVVLACTRKKLEQALTQLESACRR